jgi:hypothetical protein
VIECIQNSVECWQINMGRLKHRCRFLFRPKWPTTSTSLRPLYTTKGVTWRPYTLQNAGFETNFGVLKPPLPIDIYINGRGTNLETKLFEVRHMSRRNAFTLAYQSLFWQQHFGTCVALPSLGYQGFDKTQQLETSLRATPHTSQEPWPWNCESPQESVQRPSQDTSNIL